MTVGYSRIDGIDPALRAQRRVQVAACPHLWGIDRAELVTNDRERCTFDIHFIPAAHPGKPAVPPGLKAADIVMTAANGTQRHGAVGLRHPARGAAVVRVDFPPAAGRLAQGGSSDQAFLEIRHDGLDPLLAKTAAPLGRARLSDRDPAGDAAAPPDPPPLDGSYLAKDFDSYHRLMLDRMAAVLPEWRERHPADIGNAIVDILAYAADSLSYYQDAVATEAYLSTARRRVSLKRHARLLDYPIHEGCAARVWVQIQVSEPYLLPAGLKLFCDAPPTHDSAAIHVASRLMPPDDGTPVFETLIDAMLRPEHDRLDFYAWGAETFHLPAGATSAALAGRIEGLAAGDVLILAAMPDPDADTETIADIALRHAVRLDRKPRFFTDPLTRQDVTGISWAPEDALPFELPVTCPSGAGTPRRLAQALGNIVPADAGFTLTDAPPDVVVPADDDGGAFRLELAHAYPIHAVPYDAVRQRAVPAARFTDLAPLDAVPAISVAQRAPNGPDLAWSAVADLLTSDRFARVFVAETEADGTTALRFGDNRNGQRPPPGARLRARYRVGMPDSNIRAESIASWSPRIGDTCVSGVWNPLPAGGGIAAQPIAEIRFHAPQAFRGQKRCVLAEDYVDAVMADARVGRAVAEDRWTGSWNTTFVHVQPVSADLAGGTLLEELAAALAPLRLIGAYYGLRPPHYVPLDIALAVTVKPPFAPIAVERAVAAKIRALHRFGALDFGQTVYLSPIVAAAMDEPGVTDVEVTRFQPFGKPLGSALKNGRIDIGRHAIALLDDHAGGLPQGRLLIHARMAAAS